MTPINLFTWVAALVLLLLIVLWWATESKPHASVDSIANTYGTTTHP
jgi:hypothetical protein